MSIERDKLRKTCLLMLRSTIAGETMAARDALLRLAQSDGFGPHELTDAFVSGAQKVNGGHTNGAEISTREMAQRCLDRQERGEAFLSDKERKFLNDMTAWRKPTEKQIAWLEKIYARVMK